MQYRWIIFNRENISNGMRNTARGNFICNVMGKKYWMDKLNKVKFIALSTGVRRCGEEKLSNVKNFICDVKGKILEGIKLRLIKFV